jgi:hypothetical protein
MSRSLIVPAISALAGVLLGGLLMMKVLMLSEPPTLVTVDLVGIVDRLRAEVVKQGGDPDEVERVMTKKIDRLAQILAELGKDRLILNEAAVVGGGLPDVTEEIEVRLKEP